MAETRSNVRKDAARRISAVAGVLVAIASYVEPARAESFVIDGEEWIVGEEEAALCSRALTECTPIFGKLALEEREAALREKRLREKLRNLRAKRESEVAEMEELRARNIELETENTRMSESTSWWLTRPLRWLRGLVAGGSS